MQCPGCQSEVRGWHFYCPSCRTLLRASPGAIIAEATHTQPFSSRLIRRIQIVLLVAVLAGLVTAVMMTYAGNGRPSQNIEHSPETETQSLAQSPTPSTRRKERQTGEVMISVKASRPATEASTSGKSSSPQPTPAPVELGERRPEPVEVAAAKTAAPQPTPAAAEAVGGVDIGVEPLDPTLTRQTGLLTIKSYVPARIYINDQYSGVTPRTVKLLAGEHTITLMAEGYEDWTRKVQVKGQQQVGLLASLRPRVIPR